MALIKPEIFADVVREKINGKVRVLNLATELDNIGEYSVEGETVHFPKWAYVGDATEIAKGDTIATTELDQVDSTATIKQVAKGVTVFDRDVYTVKGGQKMVNEASDQIATAIARKLDSDLITEMKDNAVLTFSALTDAKALTQDELLNALNLFGEDQDRESFSGIVINSVLINSFYQMPLFVDVTKTTSSNGNGIITGGLLGYFTGVPVWVSDKGTLNGLNATTFIIKKGALGYKLKAKGVNVEEDRVASKKKTDIFGDSMYAVKLTDESGVVVVEKA